MLIQLNLEAEKDVESGNWVSVRDRAESTALRGGGEAVKNKWFMPETSRTPQKLPTTFQS